MLKWLIDHSLVLFALLILFENYYWLLKNQKRLKIDWKMALLTSLLHVVIGTAAMKLMAIIEVGGVLERAASLRLYGAFFLLPVCYYIGAKYKKKSTFLVLDVAAVCVVVGALNGRLHCFVAGCCEGLLITAEGASRWPIREAELVYYLIFLILYAKKIYKGKTWGQVYSVFLISYGLLRFVLEWMRDEFTTQIGILHLAHIWSLVAIAVGVYMYIRIKKTNKAGANRRNGAKQKGLAKGGN